MAATSIAEQAVAGAYTKEGGTRLATLTMTESDPTNMNSIVMSTGRVLVLFQNTDGVNAEWVTVKSSKDAYGRYADIDEEDIAATKWGAFLFAPQGWEQTLGGRNLLIDTESTDVDILAIPV